jgi:hypothetical protein
MYNFIDLIDPNLVKEYALERYTNGETGNHNYKKPEVKELKFEKPVFKKKAKINLPKINI